MSYKMIITDMDDTLLDKEHQLSEENKLAILEAQSKGLKFVLASGRPTYAMRSYAQALEMHTHDSYFLSYNGAIITKAFDQSVLYQQCLSKEEAHLLCEIAAQYNIEILTYDGDEIVSATKSEYIDVEIALTGMPFRQVANLQSHITTDVVKCIMLSEPSALKKIAAELQEKYSDRFSIAISKPFFLEFMKKGVDKGASLRRLADHINISLEDIIAVGDSYNDATLLATAGYAVAVENAVDDIKAIADHIAPASTQHALKYVIEKIALADA